MALTKSRYLLSIPGTSAPSLLHFIPDETTDNRASFIGGMVLSHSGTCLALALAHQINLHGESIEARTV